MKCHVAKCRGKTIVKCSRVMSDGLFDINIPKHLQSEKENTVVRKRKCLKCDTAFYTKEFSTLTKW